MTPQAAAGLTAFVGVCLLAGWIAGFRHRSYVGWLGFAFLGLSGFLLAVGRVQEVQDMGGSDPRMVFLARALLAVWIGALTLAAVSAVRETARRLGQIKRGHEEAAQGFLEMVRAASGARRDEPGADAPGPADGGDGEPPAGAH